MGGTVADALLNKTPRTRRGERITPHLALLQIGLKYSGGVEPVIHCYTRIISNMFIILLKSCGGSVSLKVYVSCCRGVEATASDGTDN